MKTYGHTSYLNVLFLVIWLFILTWSWMVLAVLLLITIYIIINYIPLIRLSKDILHFKYLNPLKASLNYHLADVEQVHIRIGDFKRSFTITIKGHTHHIKTAHSRRSIEKVYKRLMKQGVHVTTSGVGAIEWVP